MKNFKWCVGVLICIHVYMWLCMCMYVYACIHVCMCMYVYACIHVCMYMYMYVYVCSHVLFTVEGPMADEPFDSMGYPLEIKSCCCYYYYYYYYYYYLWRAGCDAWSLLVISLSHFRHSRSTTDCWQNAAQRIQQL